MNLYKFFFNIFLFCLFKSHVIQTMTTQQQQFPTQPIEILSAQQIEKLSDKTISKFTESELSQLIDRYLLLKDIKNNKNNIEFIETFFIAILSKVS